MIISFKPGEITDPHIAHEAATKIADATLKGKHEYVLSTHGRSFPLPHDFYCQLPRNTPGQSFFHTVLVCLVHACIPSQGTPSPLAPSQAASVISCMVSRILTPPGRHHSGVSLSIRRFVKKAIAAAMFQCKPLFLFILGPIVLGLIRNPIWQDSGELASSFNYQSADPAF